MIYTHQLDLPLIAVALALAAGTANAGFPYKVATGADGDYVQTQAGDERLVRNENSPKWLEAVGKMQFVDYRDDGTAREVTHCSINLVAEKTGKKSKVAITAAHCVWKWRGADGSWKLPATKDNVVFWSNQSKKACAQQADTDMWCGASFYRIARVHYANYSDGADIAIVELNDYVDNITPLIAGPWGHEFEHAFLREDGDWHDSNDIQNFQYMVAGYSMDVPLGDRGRHMTYDEGCYFSGGIMGVSSQRDSRCWSYGGASGGAFVLSATLPPYVGTLPEACMDEEWGYDFNANKEIDDPRIPPGYDHMWCDHIGTVYYPTGKFHSVLHGDVAVLVGVVVSGSQNREESYWCESDYPYDIARTLADVKSNPEDCHISPAEQYNDRTYWTPVEYIKDTLMEIFARY